METERSGTAGASGAAGNETADLKRALADTEQRINGIIGNSGIFGIFAPIVRNQKKQLIAFPVERLPDGIKPYIEAVAESLQVPVDMIASFVLVVLSVCIHGKWFINVKPDWTESLNLYLVVVGRPSERKSPALKETTKPIFKYMDEENERRKPEIAEYELKKKIINGQLKAIQEALSKKNSKAKYTMQDALDCQKELDDLKEVKLLRLIVDDVTPEALVRAMKDNDETIGLISAEGGIFGMMAGRYSNNTNIDIFLKGYSGEYYSSIRVGSGGIDLKHPYLTIGLAVQPQVIADIMDNKDFRGRGLLARFLYSVPNTRVGERTYRTKAVSPFVRAEYERLCEELLKTDADPDFAQRIIKLSPEADKLAEEYYQWIEHQLTNELEEIEDWAGKLHGNTMRIAGILHIVKHYKDGSVRHPVSADTMEAAIEIGKYYLEHSKAAFDIMGLSDPPEVQDAKYIISRLDTNNKNTNNTKNEITKRDLWQLCKGHFKDVEEMEPGLQCLVEHGYIARETKKPGRGRPSEKIYINPEYYKWKEKQK